MIRPGDLWGSMVRVESGGNPNAVGKAGEIGLVQIKPSTAAEYGVRKEQLYRPDVQWMLYNRIMGEYLQRYGGDPVKAVAAWNAGPGAVDSGRIPLSTQGYLSNVFGGPMVHQAVASQMRQFPPSAAEPDEDLGNDELATKVVANVAPRTAGRAQPASEEPTGPSLAELTQRRRANLQENWRRVTELLG